MKIKKYRVPAAVVYVAASLPEMFCQELAKISKGYETQLG
jgi:hypothetical protein